MSLPRYPKYKDSGVEWLGEVPELWHIDRMKWSTRSCKNGIWGEEAKQDEFDIPCVRVADFDRARLRVELNEPTIRNVSESERSGRTLRRGDLLLEKSGGGEGQPVGCVVLYDDIKTAVCSNFVAKVEIAAGMNASFWRYLHAAAYSIRLNTRSIKQTSGIQNLDQQQYFDELSVYPPEAEQCAIASFLDRETAKIDALVAEQQRLIELLKEKRQAVISHAVTKGLNPNAPMKPSGIEWLGDVPANWELKALKRIVSVGRRVTYGIVQPGEPDPSGRYMIRGKDYSDGWCHPDEIFRVSDAIEVPYTRSRMKTNDLVLTIVGAGVGTVGVIPSWLDGANITQTSARIAIDPYVADAEFCYFALQGVVGLRNLERYVYGSAQPRLNIEHVNSYLMTVPPIDEQRQIVTFLKTALAKLDHSSADAVKLIALLQERRTALISAAVTGKIDVRGLVDQSAPQNENGR